MTLASFDAPARFAPAGPGAAASEVFPVSCSTKPRFPRSCAVALLALAWCAPAAGAEGSGGGGQPPAPEIAGKPYLVPAGCDLVPAGDGAVVSCPDGSMLHWEELAPAAPWDPEKAIRFAGQFTVPRSDRDCWVDGAPARCRTRATADGGVELHVTDVVALRGRRIALVCWDVVKGPALPPVCASVLSFTAPGR